MEKIKTAIERYTQAETSRKQSAAKGLITRIVNERASEVGATATRQEVIEVLKDLDGIPGWIAQRFNTRSFYKEGDRVMGWWDKASQVQAEALPLYSTGRSYSVSFFGRSNEIPLWNRRGFWTAQELPLKFYPVQHGPLGNYQSSYVEFPVEKTLIFIEYGYALPCPLQWWWTQGDEFRVTRSIIDHGFWQAWKWWDGAMFWYLEKRPELFSDLDWWGEEIQEAEMIAHPAPNNHSAVLGSNQTLSKIEGIVRYLE